jgi:subtilase family serine protease
MRLSSTSIAAAVAATLLSVATPALAGGHRPHALRVQAARMSPKGATTVFDCESRFFDRSLNGGQPSCYGPGAMRSAYGVAGLLKNGYTGAGETIVIIDAFGNPSALSDLRAFDAAFGIADPPSFTVVNMPGVPNFDPNDVNHLVWAQEVALDVQWSHAMAPRANIVLVAAASASDVDLLAALNFAISKKLGNIISLSFGESEAFLTDADGQLLVQAWEKAFRKARDKHITVFASAGDEGSTNAVDDFGDVFPFKNVSYPASSPNVTAVGGTNLFFGTGNKADPNGAYIGETVWNDQLQGLPAAGGGGVSVFFERPEFQRHLGKDVKLALNGHRGIPDVAYNAGVVGGVVVKLSLPMMDGFFIFGGTSAGAAQWAGIMADLNQLVGRPIGFLNNRLYRIGNNGLKDLRQLNSRRDRDRRRAQRLTLFRDITVGNNGFCGFDAETFDAVCVPGFDATEDWDLATGWGSPNLTQLAKLLDDLCDDRDDR